MKKNLPPFRHLIFTASLLVLTGTSFLPARADGTTALGGAGGGANSDGGNSGVAGPTPGESAGGGDGGANGQLLSDTSIALPFSLIAAGFGGAGSSGAGNLIADGGGGGAGGFGLVLINAIGTNSSAAQLIGGQGGAGSDGGLLFGNSGGGGGGGTGLYLQSTDPGFSFVNTGSISGGQGRSGGDGGEVGGNGAAGGAGGTGFYLQSTDGGVIFSNTGSVTGSQGGAGGSAGAVSSGNGGAGGAGGTGLYLQSTGTVSSFVNASSITGGQGGAGGNSSLLFGNGGNGGAGGTGLYLQSTDTNASFVNTGSITGGQGGASGNSSMVSPAKDGGKGGAGVYLEGENLTFTNQGTVIGGAGGAGGTGGTAGTRGNDGALGFGVVFSGVGTLVNQGTISGGVQMADGANNVTLHTGSQITGDLNMGTDTAQKLTLTGTGTENFSDAVTGATTFGGSLIKQGVGTWTLDRHFAGNVDVTVQSGKLVLGVADAISSASQVKLAGGTLNANGFSPAAFTQALTVDGTGSTLDFGAGHAGTVTIQFADSSSMTWTSDLVLLDFTVGTDALGFGTDANGLTLDQLGDINLAGYTAIGLDLNGFVEFQSSAVPEPTVVKIMPVVVAIMAYVLWRRRQSA